MERGNLEVPRPSSQWPEGSGTLETVVGLHTVLGLLSPPPHHLQVSQTRAFVPPPSPMLRMVPPEQTQLSAGLACRSRPPNLRGCRAEA